MTKESKKDDGKGDLLRLPPELMEMVAWYLDPTDLTALRSTSRDINNKTIRHFAQALFATKAFILSSPQSMAMLVGISAHPCLGRALQKIVLICSEVVHPTKDAKMRTRPLQVSGTTQAVVPTARESRAKTRKAAQTHLAIYEEQTRFWAQRKWEVPLVEALANSKVTRGCIGVHMVDYLAGSSTPCGLKQLQRLLGYEDCLTRSYKWGFTAKCHFAEVILGAGCPLTELRVLGSQLVLGLAPAPLVDGPQSIAFSTLRVLEIRIGLHKVDQDASCQRFVACLTNATKLEHLVLHGEGSSEALVFEYLARTASFPKLKSLSLAALRVDTEDLITFIKKHQASLKTVLVHGLRAIKQTGWQWQDWRMREQEQNRQREEVRSKIRTALSVVGMHLDLSNVS